MDFATPKDNIKEIDSSIKNRWRWDWLENDEMQQYLRKTKLPGGAYCTLCQRTLQYKSTGKKDLKKHMDSPQHLLAMKTVKTNYSLEGFLCGGKAANSSSEKKVVRPVVPVKDRRLNAEALLLAFMAQKDLPYTMAPCLVKVAQELAKDPKALVEMKLESSTASYKMRHGVAKYFEEDLVSELKDTIFCLNLDESTNTNNEKVVAVLISFFSKDKGEVTVRHLSSFSVIRANAETIFNQLEEVLERFQLDWNNLLSVLLDSCNTMRGKKSGLEARIRQVAPHLLDIDGDSVHHAHNVAKSFTSPFQQHLESLFNLLHSEFHWSMDMRDYFKNVCDMLNIKFSVPERFTPHRFLSAHTLAIDTYRLLDSYTVLFYQMLTKSEREKYMSLNKAVLKKKNVSEESKAELEVIGAKLRKKKRTSDGEKRKDRILTKLFNQRTVTRMMLGIYMSALNSLKDYSVLFQKKAPMIHSLNDCQVELVREFLGYFVKPQCLPSSVDKLVAMDFREDTLLPLSDMFMGSVATKLAATGKMEDVKMVLSMTRSGYLKAGRMVLKKMPIKNKLLQCASAIDPSARGHSVTLHHLKKLPTLVTNVLCDEEEEDRYNHEIYKYQRDPNLPDYSRSEDRLDHWWAAANSYPAMQKMALSLLSCFHGPMVEGVFNIMGDVMDSKSNSLSIESLDARQCVKSALIGKNVCAVKFFKREDVLYSPIKQGLTQTMGNACYERTKQLNEKKNEKTVKRQQLCIPDRTVLTKKASHDLVAECVRHDSDVHEATVAKRRKLHG